MNRTVNRRPHRYLPAAVLLLVAALIAGGTSRPANDLIVLAASLPLVFTLLSDTHAPQLIWTAKLALGLLALAALQLVPLPPEIWTMLPGRELAAATLAASGNEIGWRPVALDPGAASISLLTLCAPIALHIAVTRMNGESVLKLLKLVAGFAIISAFLGIAQRLTGGLSVYQTEHIGAAIGLFANRNHHADLLIAGMLLITVLVPAHRQRELRVPASAVVAFLLFAVIATTSRAGIALAFPASIAALLIIWRPRRNAVIPIVLATFVAAIGILFIPAFDTIFDRFGAASSDQRITMARDSLVATRAMWPVGSGYGTFVPVYMAHEDLDMLEARYVVAAHNDFLQLVLEGGIHGVMTAIAGPVAVLFIGWHLLQSRAQPALWACWGIAVIVLLHSAVDFPLRTGTLAVIFGLCTGAAQSGEFRLRKRKRNGT